MTDPKEEAKRIVEMFDECLNHIAIGSNGIEDHLYDRAKQCAIIHVDGLIKLDNHWASQLMQDPNTEGYKSDWIAVRQELEKM